MAIAQLTHLHISVPASAVPEECFPSVPLSRVSEDSRRVFFASAIMVLVADPDRVPVDLPAIQIHDPVYPGIPEEDDMDVSFEVSDAPVPMLPPPPGFERFSWPSAVEGPGGDRSLFDFSAKLLK